MSNILHYTVVIEIVHDENPSLNETYNITIPKTFTFYDLFQTITDNCQSAENGITKHDTASNSYENVNYNEKLINIFGDVSELKLTLNNEEENNSQKIKETIPRKIMPMNKYKKN